MKQIETSGNTILVVEVPNSSIDENDIVRCQSSYDKFEITYLSDFFKKLPNYICNDIPEGKWIIEGTITKDAVFSFDPDEHNLVETWSQDSGGDDYYQMWKNYLIRCNADYFDKCHFSDSDGKEHQKESFLTLLESNGLHLTNPMGEKPVPNHYHLKNEYLVDIEDWQEYEIKTLKEGHKYLILKKE